MSVALKCADGCGTTVGMITPNPKAKNYPFDGHICADCAADRGEAPPPVHIVELREIEGASDAEVVVVDETKSGVIKRTYYALLRMIGVR